jgi:ribosomal-protein-alanine N-acetyltransferase
MAQAQPGRAPVFPRALGTARLALTPAGEGDADALHELWNHREVRRDLWRGHALSAEQSSEMVARSAWLSEREGLGFWVAREHGADQPVGFGGYWLLHDDRDFELMYAIRPSRWGQGLATEMVHALVAYGWSVLGLREIRATTQAANRASVRLLRRLGFSTRARSGPATDGLQTFYLSPSSVDDSWGA